MKLHKLAGSLFFLAIASAQSDYSSVCPDKHNGRPHEISAGYWVEYKCDYRGSSLGDAFSSASPQHCAESCKISTLACGGSTWFSNKCVLNTENGRDIRYAGAVFMKRVAQPPLGAGDEDRDPFALTCEERESNLQQQLTQCQAQLSDLQRPVDQEADATLPLCPTQSEKTETADGKKFKIWCGAHDGLDKSLGSVAANSFRGCIQQCSRKTGCTRAIWYRQGSECWLNADDKDPNTKPSRNGWETAILVR